MYYNIVVIIFFYRVYYIEWVVKCYFYGLFCGYLYYLFIVLVVWIWVGIIGVSYDFLIYVYVIFIGW